MEIGGDWSLIAKSLKILLVAVLGLLWKVDRLIYPSLLVVESGMEFEFLRIEYAWDAWVVLGHWEAHVDWEVLSEPATHVTSDSWLPS